MELRAGLVRELARARGVGVGDGDEVDGGVPGGELRAQAPDAPGADHRDPQLLALEHRAATPA